MPAFGKGQVLIDGTLLCFVIHHHHSSEASNFRDMTDMGNMIGNNIMVVYILARFLA